MMGSLDVANRGAASRAVANRATANKITANRGAANRGAASRAVANRATANKITANRGAANKVFKQRDLVMYNDELPAFVLKVHYEDQPPYYTIKFKNGKERQTVARRLTLVGRSTGAR
jgi:hypothetical protein